MRSHAELSHRREAFKRSSATLYDNTLSKFILRANYGWVDFTPHPFGAAAVQLLFMSPFTRLPKGEDPLPLVLLKESKNGWCFDQCYAVFL